jgi:vacuolar-type H+-ATPase subunit H
MPYYLNGEVGSWTSAANNYADNAQVGLKESREISNRQGKLFEDTINRWEEDRNNKVFSDLTNAFMSTSNEAERSALRNDPRYLKLPSEKQVQLYNLGSTIDSNKLNNTMNKQSIKLNDINISDNLFKQYRAINGPTNLNALGNKITYTTNKVLTPKGTALIDEAKVYNKDKLIFDQTVKRLNELGNSDTSESNSKDVLRIKEEISKLEDPRKSPMYSKAGRAKKLSELREQLGTNNTQPDPKDLAYIREFTNKYGGVGQFDKELNNRRDTGKIFKNIKTKHVSSVRGIQQLKNNRDKLLKEIDNNASLSQEDKNFRKRSVNLDYNKLYKELQDIKKARLKTSGKSDSNSLNNYYQKKLIDTKFKVFLKSLENKNRSNQDITFKDFMSIQKDVGVEYGGNTHKAQQDYAKYLKREHNSI